MYAQPCLRFLAAWCTILSSVTSSCDDPSPAGTWTDVSETHPPTSDAADGAAVPTCSNANECPVPTNPCEVAVCIGNVCGSSPAPAGAFVPDAAQVSGDCKTIACGEGGAFATSADPTDLPADDGNPCTREACDGPNPVHIDIPVGAPCSLDAVDDGVCNGKGACGVCRPGTLACDGNLPLSCDESGAWVSSEPCPFVCSGAGACTGICSPGARDCQGQQPRTCNNLGQWVADGSSCPFLCAAGGCVGSCAPGALECNGNVPQSCNANGTWEPSSPCPFACVAGQCIGLCAPGSNRCQGTSVQSCTPSGAWTTTANCPYVCTESACTGICAPGAKRCVGTTSQTCDAGGAWVDEVICQFACSSGNCTGVCSPGATRCSSNLSQTCDSQGQWQTTQSCQYACLGTGTCGGSCAPGATRCVGSNAETCDLAGQWQSTTCQFACAAGACTGVCGPGSTRCSGNLSQSCGASGQWTTSQTCPYVCTGVGTCAGECVPSSARCAGANPQVCEASGTWSSFPACTYACVNGACTGVCHAGDRRCVGNVSQTCDTTGQWQTFQACPYLCSGGDCTGVCSPGAIRCSGNTPEVCNASGQWIAGTSCSGATPTCSAGACTTSTPCADGSVELGSSAWGREDIVFCATGKLDLPATASGACGAGWHLCTSSEFIARNDSFTAPPSYPDFTGTLDDGTDCRAIHTNSNLIFDARSDAIRGGHGGSCTGTGSTTKWGRHVISPNLGKCDWAGYCGAVCCR